MTKLHRGMLDNGTDLITPKTYSSEPTERLDGTSPQAGDVARSNGAASTNGFGVRGSGLYEFDGTVWLKIFDRDTFDTLSDIKDAYYLKDGEIYHTNGRASANDGRGVAYRYNASSSATANDGSVVDPTNVAGRLIAVEYEDLGITRVEWFDIELDGSEDNSTEFQLAVTSAINASKNNMLIGRKGDIVRCDSIIKQAGHMKFFGNGIVLDFREKTAHDDDTAVGYTALGMYGSSDPAFAQAVCYEIYDPTKGRSTNYTSLTSNASVSDNVLSIASGGLTSIGISDGEQQETYVQIASIDGYIQKKTGTNSYRKAEVHRVFEADTTGNTLELETSLWNDYPTSEDERVYQVTYTKDNVLEGVEFWGIGLSSSPHYWSSVHNSVSNVHQIAVTATWQENIRVQDCKFIGFKVYGVSFANCYVYKAIGNEFRGVQHASDNNTVAFLYGVHIYHGCHYGYVAENKGSLLRHLVTSSYSSTELGGSFFCHVYKNHMSNAQLTNESLSASWAYEEHGGGRFFTWEGNAAVGCYTGFNIEGPDQTIINNIIEDFEQCGIFFSSNPIMNNIICSNNIIKNWTGNGINNANFPRGGIVFNHFWDSETAGTQNGINISDNIIENYPTIGIALIGALSINGVRIDGNIIRNNAGDDPTSGNNIKGGINIRTTSGGTVDGLAITNNTIQEFWDGTSPGSAYYYGIYCENNSTTARGCVIANNTVSQESLADSNRVLGIWSSYSQTVVNGNSVSEVAWGVAISALECNVTGNTIICNTDPTQGSGLYFNGDRCAATGNVIRQCYDNITISSAATENLVLGNHSYNAANYGIDINGDRNAILTNYIYSAGLFAMHVETTGDKNRVIGNMSRNNGSSHLDDNGTNTVTAFTTTGFDSVD